MQVRDIVNKIIKNDDVPIHFTDTDIKTFYSINLFEE